MYSYFLRIWTNQIYTYSCVDGYFSNSQPNHCSNNSLLWYHRGRNQTLQHPGTESRPYTETKPVSVSKWSNAVVNTATFVWHLFHVIPKVFLVLTHSQNKRLKLTDVCKRRWKTLSKVFTCLCGGKDSSPLWQSYPYGGSWQTPAW